MDESQTTDTTNTSATEQTQAPTVDTTATQTAQPGADQQGGQQQEQGAANQEQPQTTDVPESADAYAVEIEGFDFDAFKADNAEVLQSFHAEGMTNKQVEAVVKAYEAHQSVQMEALQQEWGTEFDNNVNMAKQAIDALGFQASDLDSPVGALKLAAAIGKYIQEDGSPQNTQQSTPKTRQELMQHEAYWDSNHPEHQRVYAEVQRLYQKEING